MTVEEFATKHRLQIRRDDEGEVIVRARHGQVYDYGSGQFRVMFMLKTDRKWNSRRRECEKAGMKLTQDGDTEGCLLFDSENRDQAGTAIRTVGAYRKVQISPELRLAKLERIAKVNEARKLAASHDERVEERP